MPTKGSPPLTSWTLLGAPLDSSGAGRGEERAPAALRAAGLAKALRARDAGDVAPPLRNTERDPLTGMIAASELVASSRELCAAVAETLERGERPLVLGGDCTLLLGALAGARAAAGRLGLWFVDGHADFLDGDSSPTGEGADMELAILTGHGPAAIVEQARCGPRGGEAAELGVPAGRGPRDHGPAQQMHPTGRHPLVEPEDVVILGLRPPSLHPDVALELERVPPAIARMSAVGISAAGALEVGARWERALRERGPAWLHLDLDVLDEASLPAVSYPQPLGLDWDDFVALARPLLRSPALVGASVADFNPDLDDPYGSYAGSIVRALQRAAG